MMAAIVFLRLNGIEPLPDSDKWEKLMPMSPRANWTARRRLNVCESYSSRKGSGGMLRVDCRVRTHPPRRPGSAVATCDAIPIITASRSQLASASKL